SKRGQNRGTAKKIENLLDKKNKELTAQETSKPTIVTKPENDPIRETEIAETSEAIDKAKRTLLSEETNILHATEQQANLVQLIATADRVTARLDNLDRQIQTFVNESESDLISLGLSLDEVFSAMSDKSLITERRKALVDEQNKVNLSLDLNHA